MQWPSWTEVAESPQLNEPGVKVALGGAVFRANEMVALYGTYVADGVFLAKCRGEPDTWITVIAIGRDIPGVWHMPLLVKPNAAPVPPPSNSIPGSSVRETGYFNLDLREHLRLPNQPSRYWVMVSMGDYVTERFSVELK